MRKIIHVFLVLFVSVFVLTAQETTAEQLSATDPQPPIKKTRPKVGVVLSGGGAKGFAHIGALKVLEEVGIPVDYIAGTSMGSIVGALYAIGYDAHTIDSLVRIQDWPHLLSDDTYREYLPTSLRESQQGFILSLPYEIEIKERKGQVKLPPGVIRGQNLYNLFLNLTIGYQSPMDFDQLPIPFACVAADSRTGKEVVFREGILPEAIRASMAIPGMFAPVEKDSLLLIDGGLINNFPVDVIREMGADIVIGVKMPRDVNDDEKGRGSISEVIGQLWNFIGQEKLTKNLVDTDILIEPYLHPFGMLAFESTAIDTIIHRGEIGARSKLAELKALKKAIGIPETTVYRKEVENPYIRVDTLEIAHIRVEGLSSIEEKEIIRGINMEDNKISRDELSEIAARIYGSGLFNKVHYRLDGDSPYNLVFEVEEKILNTLDLGIRFDTRDMASILAHTKIRLNTLNNSILDLTMRLNRNPYLKANYSISNNPLYSGGFSGKIGRNEIDVYERGDSEYKLDFINSSFQLNFSEFYFYNLRLHLGGYLDNYHFRARLRSESNMEKLPVKLRNKLYINYFIRGVFDNLDREYVPTSGQYFAFRYALLTDNAYQMDGNTPLNVLEINFRKPIHVFRNFYITPEISGRALFNSNDSIPFVYANFAGGEYNGHLLPQQIALSGSQGMELMKDKIAVISSDFRYHVTSKQQVYFNLNLTIQDNKLVDLLNGDYFVGGSIGYSNMTMLGPLRLELGYSGLSKSLHSFASIGYYF